MSENVHVIPVGFDFERLIQPISQGTFQETDRVLLIHSTSDPENNRRAELANTMVEELNDAFDRILGIEVNHVTVDDIYDYEGLYVFAYEIIANEIEDGQTVYLNISSMPRTVAFAFATAGAAHIIEDPAQRSRIHTYYVSPEKYMVIDMIEELETEIAFLDDRLEETDDAELRERKDQMADLVSNVMNRGVTRGTKQLNGDQHVEFPPPPMANLNDTEKEILSFLAREGPAGSISSVGRGLAESKGEEFDDAFRSRVQYNVEELIEKGYIHREEAGNSHKVSLSKMGSLWVRTH
ncbi:MarR family transcriptional regulator [Natronomonas sp. F2-12]|uniref:MarR family transcriptional regulator n=1 Tax=Natronomonas aquatica TaxID=2841590 RepID=A0A9R1CWD3_9EURY|nr:DUF6293 family protein [Natronomonas aquatica]MCQ4334809.1 MarR family transcriptional regulator [Natronomonas aquatica]